MDGYGWHTLGLIAATLAASWLFDWSLRFWRQAAQKQRQQAADKVLRTHGMEAYAYLPSFACEEGELGQALAAYDFSGRLVLDRNGNLVGRVLPSVKSQGPGLRLIVDNTKPKN